MAKSKAQLTKEVREIKQKNKCLEDDLRTFQNFFCCELKQQMENVTDKKYSPPSEIIKRLMNTISKAKPFYIWW